MKKIKFLLLNLFMLLTILSFTSCGDDDNNNGDDNSIVGTWLFKKSATAEMESTFSAEDNAKIKKHYEENAIYYGIYQMQMKADGTFIEKDVDSESAEDEYGYGTYKFENGKLIINWGEDDINEFDAVLANGVLTVYYDETDEYEQSSTLIEAGLSDPNAGKVTKFIGKIEYSRK